MPANLAAALASANDQLFMLLEQTRRSLVGQRAFDVALVRALSRVVSEATPHIQAARAMREEHPELQVALEHYIRMAKELQAELEKAQIMLLGQRHELDAARSHMHAVSQWTSALSSTR